MRRTANIAATILLTALLGGCATHYPNWSEFRAAKPLGGIVDLADARSIPGQLNALEAGSHGGRTLEWRITCDWTDDNRQAWIKPWSDGHEPEGDQVFFKSIQLCFRADNSEAAVKSGAVTAAPVPAVVFAPCHADALARQGFRQQARALGIEIKDFLGLSPGFGAIYATAEPHTFVGLARDKVPDGATLERVLYVRDAEWFWKESASLQTLDQFRAEIAQAAASKSRTAILRAVQPLLGLPGGEGQPLIAATDLELTEQAAPELARLGHECDQGTALERLQALLALATFAGEATTITGEVEANVAAEFARAIEAVALATAAETAAEPEARRAVAAYMHESAALRPLTKAGLGVAHDVIDNASMALDRAIAFQSAPDMATRVRIALPDLACKTVALTLSRLAAAEVQKAAEAAEKNLRPATAAGLMLLADRLDGDATTAKSAAARLGARTILQALTSELVPAVETTGEFEDALHEVYDKNRLLEGTPAATFTSLEDHVAKAKALARPVLALTAGEVVYGDFKNQWVQTRRAKEFVESETVMVDNRDEVVAWERRVAQEQSVIADYNAEIEKVRERTIEGRVARSGIRSPVVWVTVTPEQMHASIAAHLEIQDLAKSRYDHAQALDRVASTRPPEYVPEQRAKHVAKYYDVWKETWWGSAKRTLLIQGDGVHQQILVEANFGSDPPTYENIAENKELGIKKSYEFKDEKEVRPLIIPRLLAAAPAAIHRVLRRELASAVERRMRAIEADPSGGTSAQIAEQCWLWYFYSEQGADALAPLGLPTP